VLVSKNQRRRCEFSCRVSRDQIRALAPALYKIRSHSPGARLCMSKLRFRWPPLTEFGVETTPAVMALTSLILPPFGPMASHAA
jgi:hypothetical protein